MPAANTTTVRRPPRPRKRWRLKFEGDKAAPPWEKFRSEAALYEHVALLRGDYARGQLDWPKAAVWVSDDGEHWYLHERIDFAA